MRLACTLPLIAAALLCACSGGGGEPEELAALDGSFACESAAGGPQWDFTLAVSGPASDRGSVVYIETDAATNDDGYAMGLDGQLTTQRLDFSARVPGTVAGEEPEAGNVPLDCAAVDGVVVTFCATHEGTTDRPCWVCGDDSMGGPPGGASGWVDCN